MQSIRPSAAANGIDTLSAGFIDPPAVARPRVWWHWIDGNVTEDGIRRDIAWMKRIGLGGFHQFDAGLETPKVVDRRLGYMSPEWKRAFQLTAGLAKQSGLEMGIAASPGWSETGGPWVQPEDAMKKIAWSELDVAGGQPFSGALPAPPETAGPFQTIDGHREPRHPHAPGFYRDSRVFAYPIPSAAALPPPHYLDRAGSPLADADRVSDADLESSVPLERGPKGQAPAVVMRYATEVTVRSARIRIVTPIDMYYGSPWRPQLETSSDGVSWNRVAAFPITAAPSTISFAPVRGRWFRLVLNGGGGALRLAELRLSAEARINNAEIKAGFAQRPDFYALDADTGPDLPGVDPRQVVDLTGRFKDGRLEWTPPAGRWCIVRMGYSLTGKVNEPAPDEATGLEVDKYDADAVRRYISTYLDTYGAAVGPGLIGEAGVTALLNDSIETGASNWSPKVLDHFRRLRGYDPTPFLPALVGLIVGSRAQSDAFLYDYRRTLSDLMATEHYGTIARVARERGLLTYAEALESGRAVLGDDLEMRRFADIPMGAMWTWDGGDTGARTAFVADLKGASSVAHFYGKPLAAAESLTSEGKLWNQAPADLRHVLDLEFALGINRIVIHASPHQPSGRAPGMSLRQYGQAFTRNETWAEMARPWIDYIARSSFLLQQGRNVADLAYFYGEEASPTGLYQLSRMKDAPRRYAFDFVGARGLLDDMDVANGRLVTPGGASYAALYLGGSSARMTVPVLRKIKQLAGKGAVVIGPPPVSTPSLADDPAEFAALVRDLWGSGSSGQIVATTDLERGLMDAGISPDFAYHADTSDADILFVHRRTATDEIYFLTNRMNRPEAIEARFRVRGLQPELWRADTGQREPLAYRIEGNDTVVPLRLLARESAFVVFRGPAGAPSRATSEPSITPLLDLSDNWIVRFQPERGAPEQTAFPALQPLNLSPDPGIRYFSGVATYVRPFDLPANPRKGERVYLDMGTVGDLAEVRINGRSLGIAWKPPYRVDVTSALRRGSNQLEIRVANLWVNRLIGDAQPGAARIAFSINTPYKANSRLRTAGLVGPVSLLTER